MAKKPSPQTAKAAAAQQVLLGCKNTKSTLSVPMGSTLEEVYAYSGLTMDFGPICAKVNNKVEGMHYRVYHQQDVEFLDLHHPSASRSYTRSLFLILCKAVHQLWPEGEVVIDIPVANGYYCELHIGRTVTTEDVAAVRRQMDALIAAALPIRRYECTTEEACSLFEDLVYHSKVKLLQTTGSLYTTYYGLDGYYDYFYGSLLTSTDQIHLYGLEPYFDGLLLRVPSLQDPSQLPEMTRQDKMFEIFKEHHHWQDIIGVRTVGDFNEAVERGQATEMILVSEALQEKRIVKMADEVAQRKDVRMVLLAGPSSSGKTTTCKRLSIQMMANGLQPVQLSLDDYFVDRHLTPLDEKGDYDYESLYALNLPLLNEQLTALMNGEEVELPRYNFQTGRSERSGRRIRLKPHQVLVMEGIHALNPELTAQVPNDLKYKVFASALTTILLDTHNYIPTTDNRLLRRIIRDYKYRGVSAQETIRRWPSVRAGENKWIFPFQEEADVTFNTAMLFEIAVIKQQVQPLLEQVPERADEHSEAYRLLKFLHYFKPISHRDVPPISLLREFLGGSSFKY